MVVIRVMSKQSVARMMPACNIIRCPTFNCVGSISFHKYAYCEDILALILESTCIMILDSSKPSVGTQQVWIAHYILCIHIWPLMSALRTLCLTPKGVAT